MFVSKDGSIRVELIQATCRDKLLGEIVIEQFKAERRVGDGPWMHVVTTGNPHILAHNIDMPLGEFIECASLDLDIDGIDLRWPRVRKVRDVS
jgi:hypothetical protein